MENLTTSSRLTYPGRLGMGGEPSALEPGHLQARQVGDPADPAACQPHSAPAALWPRTLQAPSSPATPTREHCTSLMYYLFYYLIVEVGVYNSLLCIMAF